MQKQKVAIWGTGRFGELAYYYYKDSCEIVYFVDSNSAKWDKKYMSIPICSPSILADTDISVILAFQTGRERTKEILKKQYHVEKITEFDVEEKICQYDVKDKFFQDANSVIVIFSGGLGNQLFQYAVYKYFEGRGKKVYADISYYRNIGIMSFKLLEVFQINELNLLESDTYRKKIFEEIVQEGENVKYLIYKEPTVYEVKEKRMDLSIIDITGGILSGTFQTTFFYENRNRMIWNKLSFRECTEEFFEKFKILSEKKNLVSVHIRRGDYLLARNESLYGKICTEMYYENAMEYVNKRVENAIFCFFSDDIEWAKLKYKQEGAIFISKSHFSNYRDWYDLYLMSLCKHNIIANSTFSWWGAMLNEHSDKIVVAPEKWVNTCKYTDIYPTKWISMKGNE